MTNPASRRPGRSARSGRSAAPAWEPSPTRPPARTARTAQGAASRERLLAAAIELIAERGYSATSVDALCRRAGIVRTALYWHFGSKEGLLTAALARVADQWIEEIRESAYQPGGQLERLERALDGMRRILEERPQLFRLLLCVTLERAEGDRATRETLRGVFGRAEQAIVQGIRDAAGDAPLPDLDLVAHLILTQLVGAALRQLVDPDGVDLDRLFADLRRTLLLVLGERLERAGVAPPGASGDPP